MIEKNDILKVGVAALILGALLEVVYLNFLATSEDAILSMVGTALGIAGPVLFIFGLVQIVRALVNRNHQNKD